VTTLMISPTSNLYLVICLKTHSPRVLELAQPQTRYYWYLYWP